MKRFLMMLSLLTVSVLGGTATEARVLSGGAAGHAVSSANAGNQVVLARHRHHRHWRHRHHRHWGHRHHRRWGHRHHRRWSVPYIGFRHGHHHRRRHYH